MKLRRLKIRNFRCFKDEIEVLFDDLTVLVGKNDVGKSTILDALDIFLNDGVPDKHDASKGGVAADMAITLEFEDLPEELVVDQTANTTLESEYLLNSDGFLEIEKLYNGSLATPKCTRVSVNAVHPRLPSVIDLLRLNNSSLRQKAADLEVPMDGVDQRVNAEIRKAIRTHLDDLQLTEGPVVMVEGESSDNGSNVWKGLQAQLPAFALFKSDRASTDQDAEAQDPLKHAIKEAVKQKQAELDIVFAHVKQQVQEIADLTLAKLSEMDPTIAATFKPQFSNPNWATIFKASITGDEDVPLNKRGSGVRRLVLLNFFRAKVEQAKKDKAKMNVLYAVEEPETSQHPDNQRMLMSALQQLVGNDQVIATTHTPMLARGVNQENLRFIKKLDDGTRAIMHCDNDATRKEIAQTLGILPDNSVKVFIGVEGQTDVTYLKRLSNIFKEGGEDVPDLEDLETKGEIIFMILSGSNLAYWAHKNPLAPLERPEFHLYDRDTTPPDDPKYKKFMDEVNGRNNCNAVCTSRREIENYIHHEAINEALNDLGLPAAYAAPVDRFEDVPGTLITFANPHAPTSSKWSDRKAKEFLGSNALSKMTKHRFDQIGATQEIKQWFDAIKAHL